MKKLKIYLDTSVINFLFADDAPDLKSVTEDFFNNYVEKSKFIVYISDIVIKEIEKTKDEIKRDKLLKIVSKYQLKILELNKDADVLAEFYVKEGIIPEKKIEDAQHIAIATINLMDILLSWNFKHLANIKKQISIKIVNEREGYYYPLILTNPMEVLYEDED